MQRIQLPLLGLLDDAILPGEQRTFSVPVLDSPGLVNLARAFAKTPQEDLLVVTISSSVELPSLVTGRWGTRCRIQSVDPSALTIEGISRARLLSARGKEPPYTAEVEIPAEDETPPNTSALVAAAHQLFATLETASMPESGANDDALRHALSAVARALAEKNQLATLTQFPLDEALRNLSRTWAAQSEGRHAACQFEQMIREIVAKPEVPAALRRKLWSQIVELQKKLDLSDPATVDDSDDVTRLQRKLSQAGLPKLARETARRELRLLRSMQSNHHDYSTYLSHLEFMTRLPWQPEPERPFDFDMVRTALDRAHHGLEKPKRRIAEFLAVRKLGGESASMILCLAGPPGVGKTTIARAIAEALGKPFARVPLGGVHDESELRGHRLSYVAASPGRILNAIANAGSATAVVLLDEIDKIGADRARSPTGALLEILDPEQNTHFQDNFLGIPYDLSRVLFIATANDTSQIHPTLLDRLELCELDGYTAIEKTAIAHSYLVDRLKVETGLPKTPVVTDEGMALLIDGYTRESGVRQLRQALSSIFRSRALKYVENASGFEVDAPIVSAEIETVLGPPRYSKEKALGALPIGVATGLSVGPGGGSILFVEAATMPGRGELVSTGSLGDVLKESVRAAFSLIRSAPAEYGIAPDRFNNIDVHVHVPEASLAKEGPSAGIAIFSALVSALSGRAVPANTALSGEISLSGRVLPVGGIRAKLIAAERAGLSRVVIPEENRSSAPTDLRLELVFVRSIGEVFRAIFST